MTYTEFKTLTTQPHNVSSDYIPDLKEMTENYPYFVAPRLFLAKAYKESGNIHSSAFLNETSAFCVDRRWLYNYIFPEKTALDVVPQFERENKTSGNYFDMINVIESSGGDTKQTLKNMAEKLKEARTMVAKPIVEKPQTIELPINESPLQTAPELKPEIEQTRIDELEISENNAKKCILEKKYTDAVEILRALNLNNPKKSAYFADQIRFLEKVISNSKK
jgi:hypothetical protein